MKKYKNVLLSLGAYALATLVYVISSHFVSISPNSPNWTGLVLFVIMIIIGLFFGWKNMKSEKPLLLGNIIFLIVIIMLFAFILFYAVLSGWRG
ncbi:MAG: hypothetical protein WCG28_00455 [bacterium]